MYQSRKEPIKELKRDNLSKTKNMSYQNQSFTEQKNSVDKRRYFRVECNFRTEFCLHDCRSWLMANVLDISVAGMKVLFPYHQQGRIFTELSFEWTDSRFRFSLKKDYFYINGKFLRVYAINNDCFIAGVEFDPMEPSHQFKLVELYAGFKAKCKKGLEL